MVDSTIWNKYSFKINHDYFWLFFLQIDVWLIQKFRKHSSERVKVQGTLSEKHSTEVGVSQRSILGAVLFLRLRQNHQKSPYPVRRWSDDYYGHQDIWPFRNQGTSLWNQSRSLRKSTTSYHGAGRTNNFLPNSVNQLNKPWRPLELN